MHFDSATALLAICTLVVVLGLQFLLFWSRDRRAIWLVWFGFTFLLGAGAGLFYLIPSTSHEFLVLGGGNALRLLAFAFLWHAARVFCGRRPDFLVTGLCLSVWLALCSVPAFLASMEARIVVASVVVAAFLLLGAFELWRQRDEDLPSRGLAIMVYVSFACVMVARLVLLKVLPFPMGTLPVTPGWIAGFGLVVFIHASLLFGCFIAMTRERREYEQRRLSLIDPLTGLQNRRAFLNEIARAFPRRRPPVSVLVLDLDHFKAVNDRFGHEAGDAVLARFGALAHTSTRSGDFLFRMGGEEFCFVLPQIGAAEALVIAERIRGRFGSEPVPTPAGPVACTVSVGVAVGEQPGIDLELLRAAADAAVYEAKARGRNCVVVAGPDALRRPLLFPKVVAA